MTRFFKHPASPKLATAEYNLINPLAQPDPAAPPKQRLSGFHPLLFHSCAKSRFATLVVQHDCKICSIMRLNCRYWGNGRCIPFRSGR